MLYGFTYLGFVVLVLLLGMHPDQSGGLWYILALAVISITSFVIIFNPWNKDLFNPLKLASGLYGLSFGFVPLCIGIGGYTTPETAGILGGPARYLEGAAFIGLLGFLVMVAAYMLTPVRIWRYRDSSITVSAKPNSRFVISGLIVGVIGLVSYVILVISSGGVSHFLSYTGGRPDIFQGTYGGYFWGTFFMISGFSVYCISKIKDSIVSVVLFAIFVVTLYMLFQGREQAFTPLLIFAVFFHYMRSRLTIKQALIGIVVLLMLTAILGLYRATEKSEIAGNKLGFLVEFISDSTELVTDSLSDDIERMDVLTVAYAYLEEGGEPLYGKSLMNMLGPISRLLLSDRFELQNAGPFLFALLHPRHGGRSGIAPSLTGELYLSFRTAGVVIGMAIYGVLLKLLGNIINRKNINPVLFAAYPYALVLMALTIIAGSHSLFKILIVVGGVLFASLLSRGSGRGFYLSSEPDAGNMRINSSELPGEIDENNKNKPNLIFKNKPNVIFKKKKE